MITRQRIVSIQPESDTAKLLEQASETPLIVESGGRRFRITQDPADPFADYDPSRARQAIEEGFGALVGVDIEQLKADLWEQRNQDSLGRPA